jgi:hypothetical protein
MSGPYSYTLSTPAEQATFLRANGMPLLTAEAHLRPVKVGAGKSRSAGAKLRDDYQAIALSLRGTSPLLEQQEAVAVGCLLEGRAFHASFDADLYGDTGKAPGAGTAGAAFASGAGKYGAGASRLTGPDATLQYRNVTGTDSVTVAVWRKESSVWHDYLAIWSGGALAGLWKDGVAQTLTTPSWLAVDFGAGLRCVNLVHVPSSTQDYDDLATLPCAIPEGWVAGFVAFRAAQAWPRLPALLCEGDYDPDTHLLVPGPEDYQARVGAGAGGFVDTLRVVGFSLEEEL